MILNPSHEITLRGLPSEILDAYVRYKKGSRAIISWLVQFGPVKRKPGKTLPIRELASLAQSVAHRVKELPEVIHFYFRETIAARKRLSQYFRKSIDLSQDDADTINHEHFTTSLSKIYSDLCEQCQDQSNQKSLDCRSLGSAALAGPIKNHYACLPVEESFENLMIDGHENPCGECQHEQTYQCPGPQAGLEIENDEMSIAIETASTLERIHETVMATESCWRQAGTKEAHFVSAAGVTNAAWAALRGLETELRNENEVLSVGTLHQRCCIFRDAVDNSDSALGKVHTLLRSLEESDRAISHYSNCHKLTLISNCPLCVQKPTDCVQKSTASDIATTTSFSITLLDNILHLMCGGRPTAITTQSSPIFAEIGYLLTHRDDKSTSFRCVLGLHLLAVGYKAYLSALPRPSTISTCRITALKLSKQAASTIDTILSDKDSFPCKCPQTLAFHLSNLKKELDTYSKHKCWDLYFQSPWVSGNHMIEMLDILSYYGMHLFHYRHYVGAILHTYNVLIQLAGLNPIAPLEHLCDTFKDVFFPSGRPTSHFKNCWVRYIGARLKFKKNHKRHASDGESWCMAVPAHAARNAAGFGIDKERRNVSVDPKYDYARIDPMMKLKQQGWRIDTNSSTSGSPCATFHTTLSNLSSHITTTTPFSHLRIFRTTQSLIRSITTKLHTDPVEKEITNMCICFVHKLLLGADRIVEGRKFGGVACWTREERRAVDVVRGVLVESVSGGGGWGGKWEI